MAFGRPILVALSFALANLAALGCGRGRDGDGPSPTGSATKISNGLTPEGSGAASSPSGRSTAIDFVGGFDACTLSHRGVLLDLGDPSLHARMGGRLTMPDVDIREHEGASWVSLRERSLDVTFVSPTETKSENGIVIEARMRGGAAKSVSAFLNGKLVGVLALAKGETKVATAKSTSASIGRGQNELTLRVNGATKGVKDQLVDIDWIRVGPYDGDAPYSAPTRTDALTTVSIGGVARRGLSLRAPGSARCPGFLPNGSVLEGQIGVTGGEADAEVRVLVDRAEPRVVASFHLGGEGAPPWRPLSVPLGDVGTLGAVELVAKASTKGARVVFAEPRVFAPSDGDAVKPAPKARGVVVVVLGSTAPKSLAPYGGATATPELAQLATSGTVFESHRATTSFASGALASMLTGLAPREHGVAEPDAALGATGLTIAEAARQAGVVTAMFTANPTTSSTFGFARGWETFGAHLPGDEAGASGVFDDVAKWLEAHKDERFLVVVHARGGHPPWDVTNDEAKDLPPNGYSGSLDPKHAGEMLAKVRKNGAARLFGDADRERALALHARAVAAHDAALGKLVAHVRTIGREADTTWIVTGDVGVDPGSHAPFIDDDALDEAALSVPLVVRAPGSPLRDRVNAPTSSVDIARTVLDTLGLPPPPSMRGETLWTVAQRGSRGLERARVATTTTRFSARWSGFVIAGSRDREGKLCNLSLEPDCVSDVRATHPIVAEIMHTLVFDELAKAAGADAKKTTPAQTVHPVPDPATAAALRAWGAMGPTRGEIR